MLTEVNSSDTYSSFSGPFPPETAYSRFSNRYLRRFIYTLLAPDAPSRVGMDTRKGGVAGGLGAVSTHAGAARQPLFGRTDLASGSSNSNGDVDLDFDDSDVASAQPRRRSKKEIELDEIR